MRLNERNRSALQGSGSLGAPILTALLGAPDLTPTVISREESTATFPDGVRVVKAKLDDEDSLVAALQGQDAVVVALTTFADDAQYKIIDAAIKAGVKRFIPSEVGKESPQVLHCAS